MKKLCYLAAVIFCMVIFLTVIFLFLLSFLVLFRAPTNLLWYVAILVTEFGWLFILLLLMLLIWPADEIHRWPKMIIGFAAMVIYLLL